MNCLCMTISLHESLYLSIPLSVYPCICPYQYISIYLHLSLFLSNPLALSFLFLYLSFVSLCMSIYLSLLLSFYLSHCPVRPHAHVILSCPLPSRESSIFCCIFPATYTVCFPSFYDRVKTTTCCRLRLIKKILTQTQTACKTFSKWCGSFFLSRMEGRMTSGGLG